MSERADYEQAALWRQAVVPKLERAMRELIEARDACPVSVERHQISAAIAAVLEAHRTCMANLKVARDYLRRDADAQD